MNKYTYRLRGLSPGCQPRGFLNWEKIKGYKYEVITYDRRLTNKEIKEYELIEL